MAATNRTIDDIDSVLRYLQGYRPQAARRLFGSLGDALGDAYVEEWAERGPFAFWCRLDLRNRRRLVELAREHYAPVD